MTLIEGRDYTVRVIQFPVNTVGGMVIPNDDGSFSVYINANLSLQRQKEALKHELDHINDGDFYNGKSIEEIENI